MIKKNNIKQKIKNGENVIGTFVKFTDASTIEIIGLLGFEFFVLDNEHVSMNRESMVNIIRAADATGIVPLVRVRENRPVEILQALDSGALGVQIPQVNTLEEAKSVVRSVKYAPMGDRGFAPTHRAARYGIMDPVAYVEQSNEETLVVCYCETGTAVDNLDEILTVEGIDVIFVGPFDLSQSLGLTGQPKHPKVMEAIDKVIMKTTRAGKAVGIIASDAAEAKWWIDKGVQYITISSDQGMIVSRGKQIMSDLHINGAVANK